MTKRHIVAAVGLVALLAVPLFGPGKYARNLMLVARLGSFIYASGAGMDSSARISGSPANATIANMPASKKTT